MFSNVLFLLLMCSLMVIDVGKRTSTHVFSNVLFLLLMCSLMVIDVGKSTSTHVFFCQPNVFFNLLMGSSY